MTEADIIAAILRREGGQFTDRPEDRGGPTKWGVTRPALSEYRGRPVSAAEVAALTQPEAWALFQHLYVIKPRFAEIRDLRLRALVVDTGVLHGRGRAARWLQEVVGAAIDGQVGDRTLAAVNAADPTLMGRRLLARRLRGIADFVQHAPDQLVNLEGWINRCNEFLLEPA